MVETKYDSLFISVFTTLTVPQAGNSCFRYSETVFLHGNNVAFTDMELRVKVELSLCFFS
jgi:hypothetical protein